MTDDTPRVAQITVPPNSSSVGIARDFVGEVAAGERWISDDRLADLRLAVSEAVTNAVVASSKRATEEAILVRCVVSRDRFEVRVRDRGGGFAVPADVVVPPAPDPARESGFGLPLMMTLVDEARFDEIDGGTEVRLGVVRRAGR